MITIGVKSKAQKRVGIYLWTFLYKGFKVSTINFGRNRNQNNESHERITSNITRYSKKFINIIIATMKVVIISI